MPVDEALKQAVSQLVKWRQGPHPFSVRVSNPQVLGPNVTANLSINIMLGMSAKALRAYMVADGLTVSSGLFSCPELSAEGLSNWVYEESAPKQIHVFADKSNLH